MSQRSVNPEDVGAPPLQPGQHIISRTVHRSQEDDDSEWWQVEYLIATFNASERYHFTIGKLYKVSYQPGKWQIDPDNGAMLTRDEYLKLRALLLTERLP